MQKITVIIPYREDRGWLQQAIDSIPKGIEVILSKSDKSRSYNINKGLKKVRTEFVKFLDEDDRLTENCIVDSLKAIQGFDFIHGNAYQCYEPNPGNPHGRIVPYIPPVKMPTFKQLVMARSSFIHNPTQMYRMDIFDRVGNFDETLLTAQDWEFNIRCLSKGMKIGYCDSFLVYYRVHDRQITNTATEQKKIDKQIVFDRYAH